MGTRTLLALAVVVTAAGLAAALGLSRERSPATTLASAGARAPASEPGSIPDTAIASIQQLSAALDAEAAARRELASEVEALRDELARLAAQQEGGTPADPLAAEAEPSDRAAGARVRSEGRPASRGRPFWSREGFDSERLVAAGVPRAEAERLRERYDAAELDLLYLADQAAREGRLSTPEYRAERRAAVEGLRAEVGDTGYDRMLYATGRDNRVYVDSVLGGSPAAAVGVEPGDVLLAYDGRRVFEMRDLLRLTAGGEPDTPTRIDVERDGREITIYVPRGPLGVRMRTGQEAPAG